MTLEWRIPAALLLVGDAAISGAAVVADQAGAAPWPSWLAFPTNLFALGLVGFVLMTGKYRRSAEVEIQIALVEAQAEDRTRAAELLANTRIESKQAEATALAMQLASMRIDRDSWREAHASEVDARHQGERAWAASLEAQGVTVRLLTALETLLASRHQAST